MIRQRVGKSVTRTQGGRGLKLIVLGGVVDDCSTGTLVLIDSIPFSAAAFHLYPWPLAMISPLAALRWNRKSPPLSLNSSNFAAIRISLDRVDGKDNSSRNGRRVSPVASVRTPAARLPRPRLPPLQMERTWA
jgi:hypothetical protein